jgi:hypothetical protein
MNPGEVLALLAVVAGFVLVLRPIAGALAKRISGEHRQPSGELDAGDRDDILAELQNVRHELAELAERVDFAERLLAKPRD